MADEKIMADGLFFKEKHQNAPEWVVGGLSIKIDQFSKFVKDNKDGEYLNFQILKSKAGKAYIVLDTWKPEKKEDNIKMNYSPKMNLQDDGVDTLPF